MNARALLLLIACALAAPPARPQSPVQVSGPSPFTGVTLDNPGAQFGTLYMNSEVEPHIAVNPANPQNIVSIWQQDRWSSGGARGHAAGVSFNGGRTWQPVVLPKISKASGGLYQRCSDPWLSFSPDGVLYHVCIAFDSDLSGLNAVLVNRSVDGGLTWSDPVTVKLDDQTADDQPFNDKETLTADPTDARYVYVVWARFDLDGSSTWFSRSANNGATWEAARRIHNPGMDGFTQGNQVVVRPDGTLVNFFTVQSSVAPGTRLALIRSTDKGLNWPTATATVSAMTPASTRDPDSSTVMRTGAGLFDVAVNPANGILYCVWQDGRFGGQQFGSVAFSQSTDGGTTWSAPVAVNRTPSNLSNLNRQAFTPSVEVAADGSIGVFYYDFRNNTPAAGSLADAWLVRCRPTPSAPATDPANWTETRLTSASFDVKIAPNARGLFLGDYTGLAAAGNDFVALYTATHAPDTASAFFARDAGLPGDADGDGAVTFADAVAALQSAAGLRSPGVSEAWRADLVSPSAVDVADAAAIVRRAAGL